MKAFLKRMWLELRWSCGSELHRNVKSYRQLNGRMPSKLTIECWRLETRRKYGL